MEPRDDVRAAWDTNAANWDTNMGEGNGFALQLVVPAEKELLTVRPGDRILDIACGNGLHARRLAREGARVLAVDVSPRLIEFARKRTPGDLDIEYRVLDAASASELATLPTEVDAIICHMAVFDMVRIDHLFRAAAERLRTGASFVVSSTHPCFNGAAPTLSLEVKDDFTTLSYGVRIDRYATPVEVPGRPFLDTPVPHPTFHRPLSLVLEQAFSAGLVLTGLREPVFHVPRETYRYPLGWDARLREIPPVIVYRFQRAS